MLSGNRDHSPGKLIIIIIYMIDYDMQDVDQLFFIPAEYYEEIYFKMCQIFFFLKKKSRRIVLGNSF